MTTVLAVVAVTLPLVLFIGMLYVTSGSWRQMARDLAGIALLIVLIFSVVVAAVWGLNVLTGTQ